MVKIGDEIEVSFNIKVSELTARLAWGHTPAGDYVCVPLSGVVKTVDELYSPEPRIYGGL